MTALVKKLLPKDGEVFLHEKFFNEEESNNYFQILKEKINWQQDKINMYGKEIPLPRLTAWFGDKSYTYSGIEMKAKPWTEELLTIKNKIEQKADAEFNGVLLNYYRNSADNMGWHCDDEVEFGKNAVIGSVSFGQKRIFRFRHLNDYREYKERKKGQKLKSFKVEYLESLIEIPLRHGDFLIMQGETQHQWEHEIKKENFGKEKKLENQKEENLFFSSKEKIELTARINLTFRKIVKER